MDYPVIESDNYQYIDSKSAGEPLLLLHGLFGALSNFSGIIDHFGSKYRVLVPILPMFDMPLRKVSLGGLLDHVVAFAEDMQLQNIHVLGNSLGGHIATLFTLRKPELVKSLTLTGSSGLFENAMGSSFPKRGNYEFIKTKTESTFYDPAVATKELVDEVFATVNDRNRAIRVIATAKSAIRHNVGERLHEIKAPTLLIWGKQDNITPLFVGEKFNELITNSKLVVVEECGHAPMMEHPNHFNQYLEDFLTEVE